MKAIVNQASNNKEITYLTQKINELIKLVTELEARIKALEDA